MKKIITLLVLIQLSGIGYSQKLDNIDYLNGFKQFKFGKKPNSLNDIEQDFLAEKGKRISQYTYRKPLNLGIDFKISFIDFIDNNLYKIKLFRNFKPEELEKQIELKESIKLKTSFDLVAEELIKLFGEQYKTYKIQPDAFSKGGSRSIWSTNKNYVEFCFREFSGKFRIEVIFVNKKLENKAKLSKYE